MPSSLLALAPTVLVMVDEVPHTRVLEVGPGVGKYGLLMREYLRPHPDVIDAIEEEPRYAEMFPWVGQLYDNVTYVDVCTVSTEELATYDIVVMVDVLEHLTHAQGEDLLARVAGRMVICTPQNFFQNPEAAQGFESERHESVWTAQEIAALRDLEVEDVNAAAVGGILVRLAPLA